MRLILLVAAVLMGVGAAGGARAQSDNVIDYSADDAAMNAAIREAQATLPVFWRRVGDEGVRHPAVKVALDADSGAVEHIWVAEVRSQGTGFAGVLINEPRDIRALRAGSPVIFDADRITDWTYEFKGRLWGGHTLRVMLPDIPKADAAELRQYLSDTPLEPASR
ncbi:YegJ family protein [Brevundimonas sp.]|jgi:uncharacterized protein YegJ (DUF2314 family)|uniref:YegJ family protein n=1 Tax=Brevundimonas sp. TaxID=1871086 RepID=UPI002E0F6E3F|nr:DUF2314 domain-containing protein [Brevundimonas sp.]